MNKKNIIIDTDPGLDDALALMMAIKSMAFNILAITTVCGNSTIENTTRNAAWVLKELNCQNIPIYSGADKPLIRELEIARIHGSTGLAEINPKNKIILSNNAVEKIIQYVKKNSNITLVALGPLTNVAKAIEKDPSTMKNLQEIVIMGGAIRVPGNKNRVAEFNMYVDPEAANKVFNFPIKKTLIPLDACNQVDLLLSDFERIENKKIKCIVLELMYPYIKNLKEIDGIENAIMYDPVTIFATLFPSQVEKKLFDLKVEVKGELTRGMVVPEYRQKYQNENTDVVLGISKNAFIKYFIQTLSRP